MIKLISSACAIFYHPWGFKDEEMKFNLNVHWFFSSFPSCGQVLQSIRHPLGMMFGFGKGQLYHSHVPGVGFVR